MHRHRCLFSLHGRAQGRGRAFTSTHTHTREAGAHPRCCRCRISGTHRGETRWRRRITSRPTPVASVMHPIEYSTGVEQGSGAPATVPRHANANDGPYDERPARVRARICTGSSALNDQGWMLLLLLLLQSDPGPGKNNEPSRIIFYCRPQPAPIHICFPSVWDHALRLLPDGFRFNVLGLAREKAQICQWFVKTKCETLDNEFFFTIKYSGCLVSLKYCNFLPVNQRGSNVNYALV